mmetsp:Transcript_3420/g.3984  ORF Transcript_3420/g.3984 Transcript_3420/m.3984 type:complete len:104 (-) Transcript_3420:342-653(-)
MGSCLVASHLAGSNKQIYKSHWNFFQGLGCFLLQLSHVRIDQLLKLSKQVQESPNLSAILARSQQSSIFNVCSFEDLCNHLILRMTLWECKVLIFTANNSFHC